MAAQGGKGGGSRMPFVADFVLVACVAAWVAGIVIAAASLLS